MGKATWVDSVQNRLEREIKNCELPWHSIKRPEEETNNGHHKVVWTIWHKNIAYKEDRTSFDEMTSLGSDANDSFQKANDIEIYRAVHSVESTHTPIGNGNNSNGLGIPLNE